MKRISLILFFAAFQMLKSQSSYEVISSSENELVLKISTNPLSKNDLKPYKILIGLPNSNLPEIEIKRSAKLNHSFEPLRKSSKIIWTHNQIVNDLYTGTLQISPTDEPNTYYETILIKIPLGNSLAKKENGEEIHKLLLAPKIINWEIAKKWIKTKSKYKLNEPRLPDGQWINFAINQDNIYRIDGRLINSLLGSASNFDPRSIMLFTSSSYGRDKTYDLSQRLINENQTPLNLIEIPITIYGEPDGNLSDNDFIFFYGKGPSGYDIQLNNVEWHQNLYFNEFIL